MRHFLLKARKDPQKTTGLSVLAILGLGSLILYIAYLRRPPAAAPAFSLQPPKPTTQPTTRNSTELLSEDSLIIQANSLVLEQRRAVLNEARALRTLERTRLNSGRHPPPEARSALEHLLHPRPINPPIAPTTLPTTQAVR